jgi:uncharacterized membrane protein
MADPDKETLERWRTDPNNWKMGMFYYNKEDDRLLPPKRNSSMGWTVNFANPKSYGLLVGFLVITLIVNVIIIMFAGGEKSR